MKFDPSDIQVEVFPSLIYVAYRLPSDTLFKRKYIGYTTKAAISEFKSELRELLK